MIVAEAEPVAVDVFPDAAFAIEGMADEAMIAIVSRIRLFDVMLTSSLSEGYDACSQVVRRVYQEAPYLLNCCGLTC